jgi:DNA polymerase III sliding clamp (beta) subunit (PCNA family)
MFDGKNLCLYAYDGTHFCKVIYGDPMVVPVYNCYVEFALVEDIVSLSKSDDIEIEFTGDALLFNDGKSEYRIQYAKANDLSYIFRDFDKNAAILVKLDLAGCKTAQSFLSPCVPTMSAFAALRGVYFDGNFVASNGSGLAFQPFLDKIDNPIFISLDSFQLLTGLSALNEDAEIRVIGEKCFVSVGPATYIIALMSGKFPNYERIVGAFKKHACKATFDRDEAKASCKKLMNIAKKQINCPASFVFSQSEVSISVVAENKRGKEVLEVKTDGLQEAVTFSANLSFFADYLSHFFNEEVVVTFDRDPSGFALHDGESIYYTMVLRGGGSNV